MGIEPVTFKLVAHIARTGLSFIKKVMNCVFCNLIYVVVQLLPLALHFASNDCEPFSAHLSGVWGKTPAMTSSLSL